MANAKRAALAVIALGLAALAILWDEIPNWRMDGTHNLATASVAADLMALQCPAPESTIAIYGDSHTSGGRMGLAPDETRMPFGRVLETTLSGRAKVELYAVGGHTAAMGLDRWAETDSDAGTVIIAYGTNDAAPRGWLRDKEPVPLDEFKASIGRIIDHLGKDQRQLVLMAPPPGGSRAISDRLDPYRNAVADIAQARGLPIIDPADAFAQCEASQPLLVRDALHMNAKGHACLGRWIAKHLCPLG